MKRHGCFLCILFFFISVCFSVFCFAEEPSDRNKERLKLKNVHKKIQQQKKELKKVEKDEARVIERLNRIEKQLLKENKEYKNVTKSIAKTQKSISRVHAQIEELKKQLHSTEQYLKQRLVAFYKYQKRSGMRILLSSNSYNEFLNQNTFIKRIIAQDHGLFSGCLQRLDKKKNLERQLGSKRDELLEHKKTLLNKREAIKKSQREKLTLLKKTQREKRLQATALKELENYSRELQKFIDRLPEGTKKFTSGTKRFSRMRGKLLFPANGKIITTFGKKEHPELHTFTFQNGIEIRASHDTPIKAVYDGKVVFADWFKGYGNLIIIDHGENYYSLSAHASRLVKKVGDIVEEGQTIAYVGDTSSLKGNCLYFEIRHHGKPQNPMKWLARRK